MKKNSRFLLGLLTGLAPLVCSAQITPTNFFADTFNNGSTINSVAPVPPGTNFTSYETISSKTQNPTSSVAPNNLQFGITNTSGGTTEIQALFSTNAVNLVAPGTDYIQLTVVFTNTSGGLLTTGLGFLGFGLYNSAESTNYPVPGGLNGTASTSFSTNITANATTWFGYFAQVAYSNGASGIITRPIQNSGTLANNCQDLLTTGSGTGSFKYPTGSTVGSTVTSPLKLGTNAVYTDVLTIFLNAQASEAITNTLYAGPNTNGAVLTQFGGVATNSTLLSAAFNALGVGWYQKTSVPTIANIIDISSITVSGFATPVTGPPAITSQPVPTLVTTNGSCAFSVSSSGFNVTYQWNRNGTNLTDAGNISGTKTSQLVISPVGTADQLSSANGYYVTVSGAGNFSTNSFTNALTLIPATNLVWNDANSDNAWIVNDPVNGNSWQDTNGNPALFNYGDPVTFDDTGAGGFVNLSNNYLSAASVTIASTGLNHYTFQGSGSIAGPGPLYYIGSARLTLNVADTYSGGTLISNATAYVLLQNYAGLGTGPVTLGLAGGQMEIVPAGTASSGIAGNVVVADNFTNLLDNNSSFSAVFLGDMSGTAGKTLYFIPGSSNPNTNVNRIRVFGNATVYNANLDLPNNFVFASYGSSGSQTYNGVISGAGAFMEKGTTTYFNGPSTYSGGTYPAQGVIGLGINSAGSPGSLTSGPIGISPLFLAPDSTTTLTGSGMIEASAPNITIGNAIQYPTGTNNLTLAIGGTNNLTLTGPFTLQGNDGIKTNTITSRTVQVTNSASTIISGVISDAGSNYGFNLTGSSSLALNNTETYTGPTLISNATLLVNGQIGPGNVIATNGGLLGGTGTITAPVTILSGGGVTAGNNAIGTLTINNSLTMLGGSTNRVKVNKTAAINDVVKANSIAYNGTLFATNLSGTITTNDTFQVFSTSSESGIVTNVIGSPGPGLGWTFNPVTGVLGVVQVFNINSTNITFSATNNNLTLSWPADHIGWQLQAQTNPVTVGITTNNWFNVGGTTTTNKIIVPINVSNGCVFYRLILQ